MEKTLQLNLGLILPKMDEHDDCSQFLLERLEHTRGIIKAHLVEEDDSAKLCLHFDPNLISLGTLEQLTKNAGAEVSERYKHEQIQFSRLNTADSALSLERHLAGLKGMLHVNVNYAAGLIFAAYDTTLLDHSAIAHAVEEMGAHVVSSPEVTHTHHDHSHGHAHHGHDHGSAPAFLPHWLQDRWALFLVAMAGIFFLLGWLGERALGFSEGLVNAFYLLAYLAGGYDVATHAIPALFKGKLNTDILMLAAAMGAAILGELGEGAFLLLLFAIGHAGEHYALDRARNAINALGALMPKVAQLKRGDQLVEVAVETLQLADVVVVRPGDRLPADGVIQTGNSSIDQSSITGESVPVSKSVGDDVFAGTINHDNALEIRVTRLTSDNTLSRIMQLVAEVQGQQSPTQQFTDRFTSRFVPLVFLATLLMIVVPPLLNLLTLEVSFYRAMLLLVAASPCALAIGTPASVLAGIAQAARNGVLIKGGVHLENLGRLRAIAFDKTGTITSGKFRVTDIIPYGNFTAHQLLQLTGAVEQQSNHPLAQAVVQAASNENLTLPTVDQLENIPGRGVRSTLQGETILIGSLKLFDAESGVQVPADVIEQVAQLEKSGRTTMIVSQGAQVVGVLGLADVPRENVGQVMQALRRQGIEHLVMLTGDNRQVAQNIAQQVGLTDAQAELMPEDKLDAIKALEKQYGVIAMIGDGVNDAPALATATVGIAMGGAGTAVALETADVALMADDLNKLPFAVGLSRFSRQIVMQNLLISLGVIGLLIVTSVFGWVQLGIAVVLHEGSTLVVVGNALRLLRYKQR